MKPQVIRSKDLKFRKGDGLMPSRPHRSHKAYSRKKLPKVEVYSYEN